MQGEFTEDLQACKQWLLDNVVVSVSRTVALGKFLLSVSKHKDSEIEPNSRSILSRQRLHILYLVHDLLHHSKYHNQDVSVEETVIQSLWPILCNLLQLAASQQRPKVKRRLVGLIDIWDKEGYFTKEQLASLHNALSVSPETSGSALEQRSKSAKVLSDLPYNIPPTHGDPSLPFYELPAANLMHLIVPNSSQPIHPAEVRALQFSAGPADESLVNALKDFLRDVDRMDNTFAKFENESIPIEVDELGQVQYRNEAEDLAGDTYYGWSRTFCEKMRSRATKNALDASSRRSHSPSFSRNRSRSRSRSQSRSRSRSRTQRKRRRYSDSSSKTSGSSQSYSRSVSRARESLSVRGNDSIHQDKLNTRSYTTQNAARLQPPRFEPAQHFDHDPPPPHPPILGSSFHQPLTGSTAFPPPPPNWTGIWPPPPPPPPPPLNLLGSQNNLGLPFPPAPPNVANIPFPPGMPFFPSGRPNDNQSNGYGRRS